MKFSITTIFLLVSTALSAVIPSSSSPIEKRQSTRYPPTTLARLYEWNPNMVAPADGWGETSRSGWGNTGVTTLVHFAIDRRWAGRTCNLRFSSPDFAVGSKQFTVLDFTPANGKETFDPRRATWNQKTGWRGNELAVYKVGGGSNLVYSRPCPSEGRPLNFELVPSNGDVNIQWLPSRGQGLWLEVTTARQA
ncbi:hypothetical protein K440DRAFT_627078 [Wilcoxina mikolae CBS 423.85]|nr:hypothetical protein K440DRAFT_627078 [Wilcoxina mikolae CBS 423.85]